MDALKLSFVFCVASCVLRLVVMEPLLSAPLLAIYRAIETVVSMIFYASLCGFGENCGGVISSAIGGFLGILLTFPVYVVVFVVARMSWPTFLLD